MRNFRSDLSDVYWEFNMRHPLIGYIVFMCVGLTTLIIMAVALVYFIYWTHGFALLAVPVIAVFGVSFLVWKTIKNGKKASRETYDTE